MPRKYTVLSDLQRDAALILSRFMSRPQVAQVLGVGESTIWRICQDAAVAARAAPESLSEPPTSEQITTAVAGTEALVMDVPNAVRIVVVALNRALVALANGDPAGARACVKAGSEIGEFAELVKLLKKRDGLG